MDAREWHLKRMDKAVSTAERTLNKYMRGLKYKDPKQWEHFRDMLDALYGELYDRLEGGNLTISDLYRSRNYQRLIDIIDDFKQPEEKILALNKALEAVAEQSLKEHPFMASGEDRQPYVALNLKAVDDADPIITKQRLKYAEDMYSQRIWQGEALISERIKLEMEQMILVGKSPAKIAKQIRKDFTKATAYQAKRIAVTEAARLHTQINMDKWRRVGLETVEWLAEADCCSECDKNNGKEFTTLEADGMIPAHPNCRCCFKPVVDLNKIKINLEL